MVVIVVGEGVVIFIVIVVRVLELILEEVELDKFAEFLADFDDFDDVLEEFLAFGVHEAEGDDSADVVVVHFNNII